MANTIISLLAIILVGTLAPPTSASTPGINMLLLEAEGCIDNDGDDYGDPASPECLHPELDCDDTDPNISPGTDETQAAGNCEDGLDNDCDGGVDECGGCPCDLDGNGICSANDALCGLQKTVSICPTSCGPCEDLCCDVTGDDVCSAADALCRLRETVGIHPNCFD